MLKKKKSKWPVYKRPAAPVLITSGGENYVRTTTAALACFAALAIGAAGASWQMLAALAHDIRMPAFSFSSSKHEPPQSKVAIKALPTAKRQAAPAVQAPVAPIESPEAAKLRKLSQAISHDFPVSLSEIENVVMAAMKAADKTGLDVTMILSVAAKESSFKHGSEGGLIGMMRVRPQSHPDEVAILVNEGLQPDSVEGNIRLGAEILARYNREAMGDVSAALQRYHGARDDATKSYAKTVEGIKKSFDAALQSA